MIYPFFISLLLYTAVDWLIRQTGWQGEIGKLNLIALCFVFAWLGTKIPPKSRQNVAISWLLLHFVIHQTTWGIINGDPFYLGNGLFDKVIMFLCGGAVWFYGLILAAALFIGMDLMFKSFRNG